MKVSPLPPNEAERLQRLDSYRVLDTAPESRFDDIAWLASYICETPIALVSLVDSQRQWFKARIGLDAQESSREISFCSHAVQTRSLLVVPDATRDERFHDNPFVTENPRIRFYAGAPLMTHDGHALGTLCVIDAKPRSLTKEQTEALQALSRQVVAQMETNVRVAELETSRDELTRANRTLEEFAQVVSHDLQEPLRKVQAMGDRLQSKARPFLPPEQMEYLNRMVGAASRMNTLIISLLAFARLRKPEVVRETTDLNTVFTEVLGDLEERIQETNARILCDVLPIVIANPIQMRQVFQNLLANALKFHEKNVVPEIRVCSEVVGKGNATFAVIQIHDNGIGFIPELSEKIFDPFERLHSRSNYEGTGLGLAISREIVRQHNGTVSAEGQPGKGATFTIRLPLFLK